MDSVMTKNAARRVLLADDDPVTRALLSQAFQNEGYAVSTASDGIEACSLAEATCPDVALVDLLLPRRDGYCVLLFLRSRDATRKTPVLILSGETSEDHVTIARALGAQAYLTKPFDPKSVLAAVKDAFTRKEHA